MGLAQVITAVNALLPDNVAKLTGRAAVAAHGMPPAIGWVPADAEPWSGPEQHEKRVPKAFHTRLAFVNVHIWGAGDGTWLSDMQATEDLLDEFLFAVKQVAHGAYTVQQGGFVQTGNELAQLGRLYILNIGFRIPVKQPSRGYGEQILQSVDTDDGQYQVAIP